eukprot:jgi/Botrbrau1/18794/Bobra.0386s0108.1
MCTHTDRHTRVVDPTRRHALLPSKAVTVPTMAFGMGHASDALLDKCSAARPDIEPASWLVPREIPSGEKLNVETALHNSGPHEDNTQAAEPKACQNQEDGPTRLKLASAKAQHYRKQQRLQLSSKRLDNVSEAGLSQSTINLQVHQDGLDPATRNAALPFVLDPAVLRFEDVIPGRGCQIVLHITNRSHIKQHIRVLPTPEELRGLLGIDFKAPGKLSPGVTWPVTLKLNPTSETEMSSHISLLTQAGRIDVPLLVQKRFADVCICDRPVSFGQVLLHGTALRTITLRNIGAADAEYSITLTPLIMSSDTLGCQRSLDGKLSEGLDPVNAPAGTSVPDPMGRSGQLVGDLELQIPKERKQIPVLLHNGSNGGRREGKEPKPAPKPLGHDQPSVSPPKAGQSGQVFTPATPSQDTPTKAGAKAKPGSLPPQPELSLPADVSKSAPNQLTSKEAQTQLCTTIPGQALQNSLAGMAGGRRGLGCFSRVQGLRSGGICEGKFNCQNQSSI